MFDLQTKRDWIAVAVLLGGGFLAIGAWLYLASA
jgi:hypothetical protein